VKTDIQSLQGTWEIVALEVDGAAVPESGFAGSRIVVKGKTFTTISMGATYGGTLAIDATKRPKTLDLSFRTGPEKGNRSLAIFELDGDLWKLCLTITGKTRPEAFATQRGSGHAYEVLKRATGPSAREALQEELARLGGEWTLVSGMRDGQALPEDFVKVGRRLVEGNETTVSFGGQVYLKAAFALGITTQPKTIDYIVTAGEGRGETQLGVYALDGDTVTYRLAAPGQPRPKSLALASSAGGVVTVWKRKKPSKRK
jgi:uncharacterized protein (TIGR03067 family)